MYLFLRAHRVLSFGLGTGILLAFFMLIMVFAILLIRILERHGYEYSAQALSYIGYSWMAVIFLFFCTSLFFDFINLVIRAVGDISRLNVSGYLVSHRVSFFISMILALVVSGYGYFEAKDIQTERITIETSKLPQGTDRLTIAQISDVHLGLIIREQRLARMLEMVREAKPDILLSTGDLVDAEINHLTGLAELLREVPTTLGSYAITGNHEYYAGIKKAIAFTRNAGFTLMQNSFVEAGPIIIAGVDDRTAIQMQIQEPVSEQELLKKLPRDRFILFLKHQPRIDPSAIGLFDLQLSGHTHKGQIFPFSLITYSLYPSHAGILDLGSGSLLYVNRGTGTWVPPVRFLAPPEVTIIELVRKPGS
ncbi:MAG: metallophosphoesterase [Nitrospirota bacterium]